MDTLSQYRSIVRNALKSYVHSSNGVSAEIIVDAEKDHYEVIDQGWEGHRRIHHTIVHVDIIDGKLWVQHDATDRPIAEALNEAGIPKGDIVLGFLSPRKRAMSGYGVG